jgi:hypothetical protein
MSEAAAYGDLGNGSHAVGFQQFAASQVEAEPAQVGQWREPDESLELFQQDAFGDRAGGRQPRQGDLLGDVAARVDERALHVLRQQALDWFVGRFVANSTFHRRIPPVCAHAHRLDVSA